MSTTRIFPGLVSFVLFLTAAVLPTDATPGGPPFLFDPGVNSTSTNDGIQLEIRLEFSSWNASWVSTPDGVDLYRRRLGAVCGEWERITTEPLAWEWNDAETPPQVWNFLDDTATPNTGYAYQARAVDANRQPVAGNDDVLLGYATHGEALIGHATLEAGPDCGISGIQWSSSCPEECFPNLIFDAAAEVLPYINTGTRLLLHGTITGFIRGICNSNVQTGYYSTATPSDCVVSVESLEWGLVKNLYR